MTSVVTFHGVSDAGWFDYVIGWLRRRYRLVPLDALPAFYRGGRQQGNACHVTVDDGERSFYEVIFPILVKHGVHASLFVSPKICAERGNFWFQEIRGYDSRALVALAADVLEVPGELLSGFSPESVFKCMRLREINEVISKYQRVTDTPKKTCQNLSITELKEIAASGLVSIGAHTSSHPILANENGPTCRDEIATSITFLSTLLGREVTLFAYPNGIPGVDFGEREEAVLRCSGVQMAFTTESRHLSVADNPMRIPRLAVSDKLSMRSLRTKIALGCRWDGLKVLAGRGEYVERRRVTRAISAFQETGRNSVVTCQRSQRGADRRSGGLKSKR